MSNTKTPATPETAARPPAAKRKPRKSDFHKLRLKVGLADTAQAAEFCGVTVRTIQNWDKTGAPFIAMRLLHLYDRHELGGHGEDWKGWRFSRGKLICGRLAFTPRHLKQMPYYIDVYNRLASVELRLNAGMSAEQAMALVFGSPAFDPAQRPDGEKP